MAKLIVGCGYLGSRVARLWRDAGHTVFVVTRKAERARDFARQGFQPIVGDVLRAETLAALPAARSVLFAVGRDRASDVPLHELYAEGLRTLLEALPGDPEKIIYVSSTGVYAQSQGEIVDEDSRTEPRRAGGRAALAAERVLAGHRLASRGIVLRMAGIYGPGRIPLAGEIRSGVPIAAPPRGWLNLIHVDDAAAAVIVADERATPPCTFNVCDGHPVERRAYYEELARLLGAPPPSFVDVPCDAPAASRAESSKRVSSARLLGDLRLRLACPSYREGLAAVVAADGLGAAGV
jgi:nucleoside-diphosphate-sugar epimerase